MPKNHGYTRIQVTDSNAGGAILATAKQGGVEKNLLLVPVEVAPEVLAVNSDFDEGRIDPTTGYAIPDCDDVPGVDRLTGAGNTDLRMDTERVHLDGLYANDERVTDDLHKGWFGVTPAQFGDDFWDGATVTIRKINQIDEDTGHPESGQVRFYAKWGDEKFGTYYGLPTYDFTSLEATNLVIGGVNKKPGEGIYGSTSSIPAEAEFWMEGVRPGKITLEWRLQKGDIDVKFEQTFLVATQKSKEEWLDEVYYQIKLQTWVKNSVQVDISQYNPQFGYHDISAPNRNNLPKVLEIYYYYRQLFKENPEAYLWAGMAKTAAAPIYAGMSDLNTWLVLTPGFSPGLSTRDPGVEIFIEELLLAGQKKIFTDMSWSHRAYSGSGIWALNFIANDNSSTDEADFQAWKDLDEGILNNNTELISLAAGNLLIREQRKIVQSNYDTIRNLPFEQPPLSRYFGAIEAPLWIEGYVNASEWLSLNSNKNPIPGGPGFRATVPQGKLDKFVDRWIWSFTNQNSMFNIWSGKPTATPSFTPAIRMNHNNKLMIDASDPYSFAKNLPNEP